MDIRAMLLVGGVDGTGPAESIAGVPMAFLDVLGLPVWKRVLHRLQRFGVSHTTLIGNIPADAEPFLRQSISSCDVPHTQAEGDRFWQVAGETFQNYARDGADLVITIRIGPYVEVDYEEMVQHHFDRRCAVTMATDSENSGLDLFVLNATARLDAATLFQSGLLRLRRECEPFQVAGYCNRLQNAPDLRRLAVDGLMEKNSVRPHGTEWKPGVWTGPSAKIHRKARILAPAYVGAHAKVRASALITRGTVIEHHAEVDCGTVVENSTVLPFTRIGAGLDVMHSVVGFRQLTHLLRRVEVEIRDGKLIGMAPLSAVSRLAGSTAALFAFLPKQVYRGFFAPSQRPGVAEVPESWQRTGSEPETSGVEASNKASETSNFQPNLAVARRYGEQ